VPAQQVVDENHDLVFAGHFSDGKAEQNIFLVRDEARCK